MSLPQPVPPSWKDLGKSSNDLLGKDFPFQGVSLEVKTLTPSNVAFKVGGTRDTKSNLIAGDIEAKFFNKAHGLVFTQTWTTSNILKTQIELENQIAKGVKLDLQTALTPDTGAKSALFTTTYKQPGLHTRAFLDVFKGPTFTADAVLGRDGFLPMPSTEGAEKRLPVLKTGAAVKALLRPSIYIIVVPFPEPPSHIERRERHGILDTRPRASTIMYPHSLCYLSNRQRHRGLITVSSRSRDKIHGSAPSNPGLDDIADYPVHRLDNDTLLEIFEYLPYYSVRDVSAVCKWLREACKPYLFRNMAFRLGISANSVRKALTMQSDIWNYASRLTFTGDWKYLRQVVPCSDVATFVAHMPNLRHINLKVTAGHKGLVLWPYLREILSSPHLRHLEISAAVDFNNTATFPTQLDFVLPPLTSLTITIPHYKYHPRHENAKTKFLSALLPTLSPTLECLFVSLDVAPLQLIATLQWPRLRELTLQGDRRVSLDPEFAFIALLAGMPELHSFLVLRAQRSKRRRHTLWPAEWMGDVPCSKLERFEVSYPDPADEVYSHLPDTLQRLSLRCWPRHYHPYCRVAGLYRWSTSRLNTRRIKTMKRYYTSSPSFSPRSEP
ncbi:hypothetical protein NUW54_g11285 [Trametes sanguinea]|uniref:Uncharacterized protein n=1 Tax=Trametes sanguinea TaxID=158606 RepID=A0ACC1NGL2_9APHY|nr:hypothetical protein NUW54_g11285 [Trametes sanguinea]